MKTRRQKVFAILVACLFCASFFCFPVSAATTYDAVFTVPNEGSENFMRVGPGRDKIFDQTAVLSWSQLSPPTSWVPIGPAVDPSGVSYNFDFYNYENTSVVSFWIGQSSYGLERYQKSDVVYIDPGYFTLQVPSGLYVTYFNYRFSLRIINSDHSIGEVIASTSINDMALSGIGQNSLTVYYPKMPFTFSKSMNGIGLLLVLEVSGSGLYPSGQIIGIFSDDFSVHYSDGPDPNLPTYDPPDQGSIGDVDDLESDILDGSQVGLDSVAGQLDSSSLTEAVTDFQWAFVHISRFMTRLSGNIPYLDAVIYISISLGLLATLVALSGAIVTASDRRGKGSKVKLSINKKE